jgi:hypothetical protein
LPGIGDSMKLGLPLLYDAYFDAWLGGLPSVLIAQPDLLQINQGQTANG